MITNLKIGYNGRFGNQIFQFASLLGIADKIGCKAVIPTQNTNPVLQVTTEKKQFQARFELQDCFEIDESYFSNDVRVNNIKPESKFNFDDSFFNISDFTYIDGYFQSDKYFKHIKDDLLNILSFKPHILEKAKKELFDLISVLYIGGDVNKELVSLHVRRGDYAVPNPHHPVVSDIYLEKCIRHFSDEKYQFIVFSDDLEWCKQKWGNNSKFSFFSSDSHFVDFCAMTLCSHHIISNSSFSWWSSFLSKNPDKKVLAPEKWFGPGYANYITTDLYRDDMIVIDESLDFEIEKDDKTFINIFTICTGKYIMYFKQFYESCENKFLTNRKKKYFVFTDGELPNYENVVKIHQEKLGWPYDTMMRFKMFNSVEHLLDGEYVYFFNVNIHFVESIGDEVLPGEDNDYLMGVNHPGFYDKTLIQFPYERNKFSNFYIPFNIGEHYYQGCFNGGRKKEFMKMSNLLQVLIESDMSKGIIPIWHDESALNWYYVNKNPMIIDSSYAYPEAWNIPFDRKILQLDKSKMGGHDFLRS